MQSSFLDFFKKYEVPLLAILILFSRIPFLSAGYGSEEDAFGMVLTARNIGVSGIYEYSRLPGHPFPEFVYAFFFKQGVFAFNFITAILSSTGILFFMLALQKLKIKNFMYATTAFAFTPVVYIASTNCMDYMWAMSFILISFFLILSNKPIWAGIALGLAVGCRLTSVLMLLPFIFFCQDRSYRKFLNSRALWFTISVSITSIIMFFPAFHRYGLTFLNFYDTVYPAISKAIYKFTFAVYGSLGSFCVLVLILLTWIKKNKVVSRFNTNEKILISISLFIFLIHVSLFWYLPQKAAFMIPAIPFLILIFAVVFPKFHIRLLAIFLLISCFMFGLNLSDPWRGGKKSKTAMIFSIGNQQVVFDPLIGVVTDDYFKRKSRSNFASQIILLTDSLPGKTAIISGWWLGDILVQKKNFQKDKTLFLYYIDKLKILQLVEQGYTIYYLPEQDFYNDQKAGEKFTARLAKPFPI